MGKKGSSITVGYRYFFTLHMGLSRGPLDEILHIKIGDRTAWEGSLSSSGRIRIDAYELFGGETGEGGVRGDLDVMMGDPDQPTHGLLKSLLNGQFSGVLPAFRGVCTAVFDGMIAAMNPYPKPWAFRVRRTTGGWDNGAWYAGAATIWLAGGAIKAMNPAHMLYEAATNRDWGRGLPAGVLNVGSFTAAADALIHEDFGLCLAWRRQDNLDQFVQQVINHIGAALFPDRATGLLTLKLIRDDYDPAALPVFDYHTGLIDVEELVTTALPTSPNEIVVNWVSPIDGETQAVRAQSLAGWRASGAVISETREYPGLPTAELANRVAQRDLRAVASSLKRLRIKLDRRAWNINPADVIRVTAPDRGIVDMVVRVMTIDDGTPTSGAITLVCIQDVFGLPQSVYTGIQPGQWQEPDATAIIPHRIVYEWPYVDLAEKFPRSEFAMIEADEGYFGEAAKKPSPLALRYALAMRSEGEADFKVRGGGSWAPVASLAAGLSRFETQTRVYLDDSELPRVRVGRAAMIDAEIVRIDAFDLETGAMVIARGCMDTIPAEHAPGSVWFYQDDIGTDLREYSAGETVFSKTLTVTTRKTLPMHLAPIDRLWFNWRFFRPYPPGHVLANGERWPKGGRLAYPISEFTVTWTHRDRVGQVDRVVEHDESHMGPEGGVLYVLRVYDMTPEALANEEGDLAPPPEYDPVAEHNLPLMLERRVSGSSWTLTRGELAPILHTWIENLPISQVARDLALGSPRHLTVALTANREGLESWQSYRIPLTYVPAGILVSSLARQQMRHAAGFVSNDGIRVSSLARMTPQALVLPHPLKRLVYEVPYRDLRITGRLPASDDSVLGVAVERAPLPWITHYAVATVPDRGTDFEVSGSGQWVARAVLDASLGTLAVQAILLASSDDLWSVRAWNIDRQHIIPGTLCLIDQEILRVESFDQPTGNVVFARGCVDTIPAPHRPNSTVWFYSLSVGGDEKTWGDTERINIRVCSVAPPDPILVGRYPTDRLEFKTRHPRPYPPGRVLVDGAPWFTLTEAAEPGVALTWTHRDRIDQDVDVVDHQHDDIGPEPGVIYEIRVVSTAPGSQGGWAPITLKTYTVLGDSWFYSYADILADALLVRDRENANRSLMGHSTPLSPCRAITIPLALLSVRDGLECWQWYRISIVRPTLPGCSDTSPPYTPPGWPSGDAGEGDPGDGDTGQGPPGSPNSPGSPGGPGAPPYHPDPEDPVDPEEPEIPEEPETPADPELGIRTSLVTRIVAHAWNPPHGPGWGRSWTQWWNGGVPFDQLGNDPDA
ncbi:phage tail protein [Castellaniella hirudinis]|uniref:phage tail protein n=1 Tax=Castellaniella hirudinis TaxID=1144617 RepID=UPI0039C322DA